MSWNCGLRATKSVSELTSTIAPDVVLGDQADQALGRHPVRLLGGLGQALLAQPVDGLFHVAVGFGERRLAVHHAGAGLVAQGLHHARGDAVIRKSSCVAAAGRRLSAATLRQTLALRPQTAAASTSFLAAATQPSAATRPLSLSARSSASAISGIEVGDLPEVVDADIVEAQLQLVVDIGQTLQIVGLAARRLDTLEDRQHPARSCSDGGVSDAPTSAPACAWPRSMPSMAARAMRSQ